MKYSFKHFLLADACEHIFKAKAKKYESLAAKCRENVEKLESYKNYKGNETAQKYYSHRAQDLLTEILILENAGELAANDIDMLMERHIKAINSKYNEVERLKDYEAREAALKEIYEAMETLQRIESLYRAYEAQEPGAAKSKAPAKEDI